MPVQSKHRFLGDKNHIRRQPRDRLPFQIKNFDMALVTIFYNPRIGVNT